MNRVTAKLQLGGSTVEIQVLLDGTATHAPMLQVCGCDGLSWNAQPARAFGNRELESIRLVAEALGRASGGLEDGFTCPFHPTFLFGMPAKAWAAARDDADLEALRRDVDRTVQIAAGVVYLPLDRTVQPPRLAHAA